MLRRTCGHLPANAARSRTIGQVTVGEARNPTQGPRRRAQSATFAGGAGGKALAGWCDRHVEQLAPFADRYGEEAEDEPDRLRSEIFHGTRTGGLGLLRDLHDLYLMATECDISWTLVGQAAKGARDDALGEVVAACEGETATQLAWLRTRMKQAAPQALVVT